MTPEELKKERSIDDAKLISMGEQIISQTAEIIALRQELRGAVEVIKIGIDFVNQVKDQKTSWPGEIDSFDEKARAFLAKHKGEG